MELSRFRALAPFWATSIDILVENIAIWSANVRLWSARENRHVENTELYHLVEKLGHKWGDPRMNDDGRVLSCIDNTLMFRPDAIDLANGLVTLAEIQKRNHGQIHPL